MWNHEVGLQAAVAESDLGRLGLNAAELGSLAVGKVVHSGGGKVEATGSSVDAEDVDGLAVVGQGVALAAVGGVPAGNVGSTANVGELGNSALGLPAVLGDQAVDAVRARDSSQGAAGIIVTGVVRDADGGGHGDHRGKRSEDGGELHFGGGCWGGVFGGGGGNNITAAHAATSHSAHNTSARPAHPCSRFAAYLRHLYLTHPRPPLSSLHNIPFAANSPPENTLTHLTPQPTSTVRPPKWVEILT